MFLDEARLTARIAHPNVIQVTDVGTDHGSYFMVMELVSGCSLADASTVIAQREKRMQPELAVAIVHQIALGLHAAHELRGANGEPLHVVHRDVSPDNVLLGVHGAVKLIDFGIAMARERLHQTQQPTLKGKLRYLAPEQLGGTTDRRTDIFALGIVLWELLTGHRLYEGASEPELLDRVRAPRIMAPSGLVPEIGPALDRVIAAMTAVDPEARPATAADAAALLLAAFPQAGSAGAVQIAQLATATMSGGLGVSDGVESIAPSSDLAPLTMERRASSAYTTGRILLPQPARPGAQGPLFGAAVVTAIVLVLGALVYGYQIATEGSHEIHVHALPPRAAPAPAPQPTLVTTAHAPIAPLPAAAVSSEQALPPAATPTEHAPTRPRTVARSSHRPTAHTVVDGTTLAHEL
jgi:serine/threonine-protein kinase